MNNADQLCQLENGPTSSQYAQHSKSFLHCLKGSCFFGEPPDEVVDLNSGTTLREKHSNKILNTGTKTLESLRVRRLKCGTEGVNRPVEWNTQPTEKSVFVWIII